MSNELWVIADAILFMIMLLPLLGAIKWRKCDNYVSFVFSKRWVSLLLCGCLIFCLYNKTEGDYFHYQDFIEEINSSRVKESMFEAPYMFLISILGNNYFMFRLIVWGSALFLFREILKVIKLENNLSVSIFILFALIAFAYGRVALALSIFYLGAVYYYQGKQSRQYTKEFWGILLIMCSLLFHKSIILLIILFLLLSFFKLNKIRMLLIICLIPVFILIINTFLSEIFSVQTSMYQINRGIYYLSNKKESLGPAMIISIFLNYIPILILMFVMAKEFYNVRSDAMPLCIKKMYEIAFILIWLSLVLLFVNSGGRYLFTRIKEMALIPFSIILSYYLINFNLSKWQGIIPFFTILCSLLYYFAYAYYLKSIGSGI